MRRGGIVQIGVTAEMAALRAGIATMLESVHAGAVFETDDPGRWAATADSPIVVVACSTHDDMSVVVDLRDSVPACGVVALVPRLDSSLELAALSAGAGAVDSWSVDANTLNALVELVAARRTVLQAPLATRVVEPLGDAKELISAEETSWLARLASGITVAALANESGFSEREMYRRLKKVYQRLGAQTKLHALLLAVRNGLIAIDRTLPENDAPNGAHRASTPTPSDLPS